MTAAKKRRLNFQTNKTSSYTAGKPAAQGLVDLPVDVLHHLVSNLPVNDPACLALTCQTLNTFVLRAIKLTRITDLVKKYEREYDVLIKQL